MRNAVIQKLVEKARTDDRIFLLTADLGYGVLEPFINEFPRRFINVGVSEQLMIGIAAGLAKEGMKPYCYSINNFISFRCLEQIRNDIAYPNLDVKLISLGAGMNYDNYGFTHYGIEDKNVISSLPNIKVFSPTFECELDNCLFEKNKPAYIRLAKGNKNFVRNRTEFEYGKSLIITESDLVFDIYKKLDCKKSYDVKLFEEEYFDDINECDYENVYFIEEHTKSKIFSDERTELEYKLRKEEIYHRYIEEDWINQGFSPDKRIQSDREWVVSKLLEGL